VRVESCLAYENKFYGIAVADAALQNPPRNWIIQPNQVSRNVQGGIGILNGSYDVAVLDNSIASNAGDGIWVGKDCHGIVIRGNRCRENGLFGIRTFNAWGLQILNNLCWNNGQRETADGISCLGAAGSPVRQVVIMGNLCFDDQETKTQRFGIAVSQKEDCRVTNNLCEGNAQAAYNLQGNQIAGDP
jgi:hypothetical protein